MKTLIAIITAISLAVSASLPAYAHSGRTDKNGCHAGSKPYHCHNSGSSSGSDSSGAVIWISLAVLTASLVGLFILTKFVNKESGPSVSNATYSLDIDPDNQETRASAIIKW